MTDEPESPEFERLLQYLRETRGFDFSGYKRTTLLRRIEKRMAQVGVKGHGPYLEYLQAHPDEFGTLFNTILINVTSYFRDAAAWDYVRTEVLPRIIEGKAPYEPIRVWSAGVASGEEAYSVAMLFQLITSGDPPSFSAISKALLNSSSASRYSARARAAVPAVECFRQTPSTPSASP